MYKIDLKDKTQPTRIHSETIATLSLPALARLGGTHFLKDS